jgi:hypothetical protein
MRWVRRGAVGLAVLAVLAVLVPALVVTGAIAGLSPRHWSDTQLAAVQLPYPIDSRPPPDTEGRTYTERELDSLRDGLTPVDLPEGSIMFYTDGRRRQVIVATAGLAHGGFALCGDRYGDAVALTWRPLDGAGTIDGPATAPSAWRRPSPFTSWLTLATGFPWYLAAGVLLTVGGWLLVRWRRRSRPAAAPIPAGTPTRA